MLRLYVQAQRVLPVERPVARAARVRFRLVDAQVLIEFSLRAEALAALFAGIRFLTRVHHFVAAQAPLAEHGFAADVAREPVHDVQVLAVHVRRKRAHRREGLIAQVALERFPPRVRLQVFPQGVIVAE